MLVSTAYIGTIEGIPGPVTLGSTVQMTCSFWGHKSSWSSEYRWVWRAVATDEGGDANAVDTPAEEWTYIDGETSETLTLHSVTEKNGGDYRCEMTIADTNSKGSATIVVKVQLAGISQSFVITKCNSCM